MYFLQQPQRDHFDQKQTTDMSHVAKNVVATISNVANETKLKRNAKESPSIAMFNVATDISIQGIDQFKR